jgi:hypothetical protein
MISDAVLKPRQTHNADKTCLCWIYMPQETHEVPNKTVQSGFKDLLGHAQPISTNSNS